MPRKPRRHCPYQTVELNGVRLAILHENVLLEVCRRAGVEPVDDTRRPTAPEELAAELDDERLARRLLQRRKRVGLTQAELAQRAGIRVETLNRVERGRTTPDFSTVRKLAVAMKQAEAELAADALAGVRGERE